MIFINLYCSEEWCLLGCYAVWFLQEPHGVTTQKTPFFIVTVVKTSNLTLYCSLNILQYRTFKAECLGHNGMLYVQFSNIFYVIQWRGEWKSVIWVSCNESQFLQHETRFKILTSAVRKCSSNSLSWFRCSGTNFRVVLWNSNYILVEYYILPPSSIRR
jgi:hypothetical protein